MSIKKSVLKIDNKEKLHGEANYVDDLRLDKMLFAKTLRSSVAHGKIEKIDIPKLPEGYFIVDRNDISGKNVVKMIFEDQPIFANQIVHYIGEPILLVVGEDRQVLDDILTSIKVSYKHLEPSFDMEGSLANFVDYNISKGDSTKFFSDNYNVFEDEYSTGYQEHAYLEPQGMIGSFENGKICVYGSIQCPYYIKSAISYCLGFEDDKVRVVQTSVGGAFGGKEDYPSIIACQVAVASVKTGRPVKIVFDRQEDVLVTTKRHPSKIKYKTSVGKDGKIVAMDIDVKLDAGAYSGLSSVVLQRALFAITGVYNVPNIFVRGRAIVTNNVPSGAFRGFGCPQSIFAIEMHIFSIALKLGKDPLDFKLKNLVKRGDLTSTSGCFRYDVKVKDMVKRLEVDSDYRRKYQEYENAQKTPQMVKKGIGMSLFLHGCGFTGSGEQDHIKAEVALRKNRDGSVDILVANVDMGQGIFTTFRKIVSKILDIPMVQVNYDFPDTDKVPDSGPTVASRTIMIVGGLLEKCAKKVKDDWDKKDEFEVLEKYKQPSFVKWDADTFTGDAYPTYSWGVNVVEVEVDMLSFEITTKKVWTVFDVGVTIDERIMKGQVEGGVLQGLGYATLEVMEAKGGKFMQKNMTDYIIPTFKDSPEISTVFVDNPYEGGPFGAKGAGELTFIGAAPALACAVQNALGVEVKKIPVTPEYLSKVMGES